MTEIKFSYNPFKRQFLSCSNGHSIELANKGIAKEFNEHIRLIVVNNKLYLRLYYPFNDLNDLSLVELRQASYKLLKRYTGTIKRLLRREGIAINEVFYNVDNDLLKGINLVNI